MTLLDLCGVGGKAVVVGRICLKPSVLTVVNGLRVVVVVVVVVVLTRIGFIRGLSNGAKKFGGGGKTIPGTKGPGGTCVELSIW